MVFFKLKLKKNEISYDAETLLFDQLQYRSTLWCTEQRSCPEIISRKLHLVLIDARIFA